MKMEADEAEDNLLRARDRVAERMQGDGADKRKLAIVATKIEEALLWLAASKGNLI
jgi:hypothetical protein